jgi:hypothetical protein
MRAGPALLLALAACGPVSVAQAERECFETARLAAAPRGEIGVGVTSTGEVSPRFRLEVSSDYFQGRDPSALYDACVFRKSGQPPRRPLYDRPDWKG